MPAPKGFVSFSFDSVYLEVPARVLVREREREDGVEERAGT